VRAHWGDASLTLVFLLFSTAATLGLSGACAFLVDNLTQGFRRRTRPSVQRFLGLGAVAAVLAVATACASSSSPSWASGSSPTCARPLYGHILTLDPAFFLQTRTGEVLSRLTTDIAIVENLLATSSRWRCATC
jgi:ATP-binding cassette subfamily B protein